MGAGVPDFSCFGKSADPAFGIARSKLFASAFEQGVNFPIGIRDMEPDLALPVVNERKSWPLDSSNGKAPVSAPC